jgi:hypothetical protein
MVHTSVSPSPVSSFDELQGKLDESKRRALWFGVFVLVLWLLLGGILTCEGALKGWQVEIETLNGATWPSDWETYVSPGLRKRAVFAYLVAARTIVNLVGPLAAVFAVIYFLRMGIRMNLNLEEALRVRSAELAGRIYFRLQKLVPDMDKAAVQAMLQEEAGKLDPDWFKRVQKESDQSGKSPSR